MPSKDQKRLLEIVDRLPPEQQAQLCEFAEFLYQRHRQAPVPADLVDIARPQEESVIQAIKRLTASYPMLDTASLLSETSVLMNQHLLQARPAAEVIDELESLFRRHFERLREGVASGK